MSLPIGIDDFKDLRETGCVFVDKTLFIQEIINDSTKAFIVTRPRRFGKTLNMSILRYFFDMRDAKENRKLFEDTLIAKAKDKNGKPYMEEQGQYPVIFITLKDLRTNNYKDMIEKLATQVSELYKQHEYLLEDNLLNSNEKAVFKNILYRKPKTTELQDSLNDLGTYLHRYYNKKVIILMDEYDTPMHEAYVAKEPFHEELLEFMKSFFSKVFKGNPNLHRAILTGILRVSLLNLLQCV